MSLLADADEKFRRGFFYWAGFIQYGFAGVKLDNATLDQICSRLEKLSESNPLEMSVIQREERKPDIGKWVIFLFFKKKKSN